MPHLTRPTSLFFLAILLFVLPTMAQRPTQAKRPPVSTSHAGGPVVPTSSSSTSYKGVFEPVNYKQDINFTDVFFVSPEVGWVSGDHATILKTSDGGNTWVPQVGGDANNNEKPIEQLRFLDERRGWAIADGPRLLRTLDGQNWDQVNGEFPRGIHVVDYTFTSVRHGILLGSNNSGIFVTNDGGRHWQLASPCQFSATVQGLSQREYCHFTKLQMLSARLGYVLATWSSPEAPNAGSIVLLRTEDAGEHWTPVVPDLHDCCGPDGFFTDVNHGVILYNNGKTYLTSDGGQNWHVLLSGSVGLTSFGQTPAIKFADPEVGWVLGRSPDNSNTFRVSFSTDSGQQWKMSGNIKFPAETNDLKYNFPRRDRAYVIGPHGMIYRYRIVPASYTAANALFAPAMPAFGALELTAKANIVRRDIEVLRSKLPQLPGPPAAPATGGTSSGSASFNQAADLSPEAVGDFAQDTSPASAALGDCCSAALQQLQSDTAGLVTQVPTVTSQYRPLNLIIAGAQLAANLLNQGKSLWNQFRALKHAPNATAATAALQQFASMLDSVQQTSSTGFQNPGNWFATNAPADFVQDVGPTGAANSVSGFSNDPSTTASANQNGANMPAGTQFQPVPTATNAQNSVNQTIDKAKKVKDTLRGLWH